VESSFICKNYIDCRELWADEDLEMIAVEVKSRNPKFTWEIVGMYRAPNDGARFGKNWLYRKFYKA